MSELLRKAEWLVSIASPTTHEQEICRQLLDWVNERFPETPIKRFREGFRFQPRQPSGRPRVALVGHIDTVPQAARQHLAQAGVRLPIECAPPRAIGMMWSQCSNGREWQ